MSAAVKVPPEVTVAEAVADCDPVSLACEVNIVSELVVFPFAFCAVVDVVPEFLQSFERVNLPSIVLTVAMTF